MDGNGDSERVDMLCGGPPVILSQIVEVDRDLLLREEKSEGRESLSDGCDDTKSVTVSAPGVESGVVENFD